MGKWLSNFLGNADIRVSISGREEKNITPLMRADIIFISVPNFSASRVIEDVSKWAKPDSLLVDLSSVKTKSYEALKKVKQPSVALHMLFGHVVTSVDKQKVVFIVVKNDEKIDFLKSLFTDAGAQVIETDAKTHDEQTAVTQALTHFANIAFAKTTLVDAWKIRSLLTTPVFLSQYSTSARVMSQNSRILAEIQIENPYALAKIDAFKKTVDILYSLVAKKDIGELADQISKIQTDFAKEDVSRRVIKKRNKNFELINKRARVGYLGPEGTYSHIISKKITKNRKNNLVPMVSIYELFDAVKNGDCDFSVVPAENSTEGTVRETLDYMLAFGLKTVGSIELPVSHNLLSYGNDIQRIDTIVSHPQALAQCTFWLKKHCKRAKIIASTSTVSEIAKHKNEKNTAFIASSEAAKLYGLNILAKNIQDIEENFTKFYIISKNIDSAKSNAEKTLLFFSVFNRVGVLRDILNVIASYGINLANIESRPSRVKAWDYHFFAEVDTDFEDTKLTEALNVLREYCTQITILGRT